MLKNAQLTDQIDEFTSLILRHIYALGDDKCIAIQPFFFHLIFLRLIFIGCVLGILNVYKLA